MQHFLFARETLQNIGRCFQSVGWLTSVHSGPFLVILYWAPAVDQNPVPAYHAVTIQCNSNGSGRKKRASSSDGARVTVGKCKVTSKKF